MLFETAHVVAVFQSHRGFGLLGPAGAQNWEHRPPSRYLTHACSRIDPLVFDSSTSSLVPGMDSIAAKDQAAFLGTFGGNKFEIHKTA